jgi:hypothetical protein
MMRTTVFVIFTAVTSLFLTIAHAEGGCPPGQYPQQGQGWKTCVSIPADSQQRASSSPPPLQLPTTRWIDHWQAVATDSHSGAIGTSVDNITSMEAEDSALLNCKQKGGTACEVDISYRNGCVARVVGETTMITRGAETLSGAEKLGMAKCATENKDCSVYYSACSRAVEVPW